MVRHFGGLSTRKREQDRLEMMVESIPTLKHLVDVIKDVNQEASTRAVTYGKLLNWRLELHEKINTPPHLRLGRPQSYTESSSHFNEWWNGPASVADPKFSRLNACRILGVRKKPLIDFSIPAAHGLIRC